ncbi:hypothetical protein MJO28_001194 [Puccinia striiformis f. sp. tritici]|uniref:Uncharacterized protein n=1 Tax=Puccinia striiformis f. sp. tritici TaxID=168172 RepID=A0ACC0F1J8_9BASI|nr:hypothetical protein MJO28_001194 [Puccinia striiformis f. sp. tritici]
MSNGRFERGPIKKHWNRCRNRPVGSGERLQRRGVFWGGKRRFLVELKLSLLFGLMERLT